MPELTPETLARWRAGPLGGRVEAVELALVLRMAGDLRRRAVLDVGCGDGSTLLAAAEAGAHVTGLDRSARMLESAQARAAERGLTLDLHEGDAAALPFADASFDLVFAVTMLCFVEDPSRVLGELARVTRPGGRVVLGELARWSPWALKRRLQGALGSTAWRGVRFWTCRELRGLLAESGLVPGPCEGAVYFPPHALAARVLAPLDTLPGRLGLPGGAFLAVTGTKAG